MNVSPFITVLLLVSVGPTTDTAPKTGLATVAFEQRSPMSSMSGVAARHSWTLLSSHLDYALSDERFTVYVPPTCNGDQPYGVVVWISPGPGGGPPASWVRVLNQYKLIWVGADHAGNGREIWQRLGLPLDGLYNLCRTYHIDPMRIYVAGFSGGGRCSSRMAINYPDVFTGAIPVGGMDYYRQIDLPEPKPASWYRRFTRPGAWHMQLARTHSRFALIVGTADYNKPQMKLIHQAMLEEGYEHVSYLEVSGIGHSLPHAGWFEKAIVFLDSRPDPTPRQHKRFDLARNRLDEALEKIQAHPERGIHSLKRVARQWADTPAGRQAWLAVNRRVRSVVTNGAPEQDDTTAEAREALQFAEAFIKIKAYGEARRRLTEIIKKYPESPQAVSAFKQLRKLLGRAGP